MGFMCFRPLDGWICTPLYYKVTPLILLCALTPRAVAAAAAYTSSFINILGWMNEPFASP